MRRSLVVLVTTACLALPGFVPAHADRTPRMPEPLGALGGALWRDAHHAEHWMHVEGWIGADGQSEILADTYVNRPVTCRDGTRSERMVAWMGGVSTTGGVVVDKQLATATVSARLQLRGYDSGACGRDGPTLPDRTRRVTLVVAATSPAIHSLQIDRRHLGGKPTILRQHTTLRLAAGTVRIADATAATTDGMIAKYDPGLGLPASTVSMPALAMNAAMEPFSMPTGGKPDRFTMSAEGDYLSGEVRRSNRDARPGHLLVDESAVNAARTTGEPDVLYAGRHTTRVIRCGGRLGTLDTYWDALGRADVTIAPSMRDASASARLRLHVSTYNSCTDASRAWTTARRAIRLDVVAHSRQETSRGLVFDHEAGWTTTRLSASTQSRDGTGTFSIGALSRRFDVGGILHWSRIERDRHQRG